MSLVRRLKRLVGFPPAPCLRLRMHCVCHVLASLGPGAAIDMLGCCGKAEMKEKIYAFRQPQSPQRSSKPRFQYGSIIFHFLN